LVSHLLQSLIFKWLVYLLLVFSLTGFAFAYPFLFELPLVGAIGGAYWIFFRENSA
jgi:hypothetical protein